MLDADVARGYTAYESRAAISSRELLIETFIRN